jgi:hypothetical protein
VSYQVIVDASLVLVTTDSSENTDADFWNFLLPFSGDLWGVLIILVVFNALAHVLMQNFNNPLWWGKSSNAPVADDAASEEEDDSVSLFDSLYQMWGAFTGGGSPEPSKYSTKLLNMGFYFVILIIMASYTANMATFLLASPANTDLQSIDDAAQQSARICVLSGSSAQSTMKAAYPTIQLVVDSTLKAASDLPSVFAKLQAGDCDGVVIANIDWSTQSLTKTSNPYCNLVVVDEFRQFSGAFPYLLDHSKYCTSLIGAVFGAILVSMTASGQLATLTSTYLDDWGTQVCAAPVLTPAGQLVVDNMAGVFFVYCFFAFLAVSREAFDRYGPQSSKDDTLDSDVIVISSDSDDKKSMMIEMADVAADEELAAVLSVKIQSIKGLSVDHNQTNLAINIWTTQSGSAKTVLRTKACVLDGESGCRADFHDCTCELLVTDMRTETFFLEIIKENEASNFFLSPFSSTPVYGSVSMPCSDLQQYDLAEVVLTALSKSKVSEAVGMVHLMVTVTRLKSSEDNLAQGSITQEAEIFRLIEATPECSGETDRANQQQRPLPARKSTRKLRKVKSKAAVGELQNEPFEENIDVQSEYAASNASSVPSCLTS